MSQVRVRASAVTDAAAVAALEQECLAADAWSPGLVAEVVGGTLPTVVALVAVDSDDEPVGYVAASLVADVAELQRLAVTAAARRDGVGTDLVRRVVGLAHDAGAARVLLEVREDNEGAQAFYARLGFAEAGRRPRYYRDGSAAVLLSCDTGPG